MQFHSDSLMRLFSKFTLMVVLAAAARSHSSAKAPETEFSYRIENAEVTILGFRSGSGSQVAIPEHISGFPVTGVDFTDFQYFDPSHLAVAVSLHLPASVASIPATSFPPNVSRISVAESNPSFSSRGGVLFDQSGTELHAYPGGGPRNYTIPEGVTRIRDKALLVHTTRLVIPVSLEELQPELFVNSARGVIEVAADHPTYSSIDGALFDKAGTTLIHAPLPQPDGSFQKLTYAIPEGVTTLGEHAINDWRLAELTLPSTLAAIHPRAFSTCFRLERIILRPDNPTFRILDDHLYLVSPDTTTLVRAVPSQEPVPRYTVRNGTERIGDYAFAWTKIETIRLPDTVEHIGDYAFHANSWLDEIELPHRLRTVGEGAFAGCSSLLTISRDLPELPDRIFADCVSLRAVEIPSGITTIGAEAFQNCRNLNTVSFNGSLRSIGDRAFESTGLTTAILPDSVTELGISCFARCDRLSVAVIGSGITEIPKEAFNSCRSLISVVDGRNVKVIGESAFHWCQELRTIPFSATGALRTIGDRAFYLCRQLSFSLPDGLVSIGTGAFHATLQTEITIPASLASLAEGAFGPGSSYLRNIHVADDNPAFSSKDGVLLSSDGSQLVRYPPGRGASEIYATPPGVVSISPGAFEGVGLANLTLGPDVASVGSAAFERASIATLELGLSVREMADDVWKFARVNSVRIDPGNPTFTSLNGALFDRTETGTRLLHLSTTQLDPAYKIPAGVTEIGPFAFSGVTLDRLEIPASVKSLALSALTSSTIPKFIFLGDAPALKLTDGPITYSLPLSEPSYRYVAYQPQTAGWDISFPGFALVKLAWDIAPLYRYTDPDRRSLLITGPPDIPFTVERSFYPAGDDWWHTVLEATLDASGRYEFVDPQRKETGEKGRYYRVRFSRN